MNTQTDMNHLYRNTGGGTFEDVTEATGVGSWLDAYAFAAVDYDRDGDLDLFVPSALGPVEVYRNDTGGRGLEIALRDETTANASGVGAVVTVTLADGSRMMREVLLSGGYLAWDAPMAHFGLGDASSVTAVEVRWPTGAPTRLTTALPAGARYVVRRTAGGTTAAPTPTATTTPALPSAAPQRP